MNKLTLTTGHCWDVPWTAGHVFQKSQRGSGQLDTGPGGRCFVQMSSQSPPAAQAHRRGSSPGTTPRQPQQACQPWEVAAHSQSEASGKHPSGKPRGKEHRWALSWKRQEKVLVWIKSNCNDQLLFVLVYVANIFIIISRAINHNFITEMQNFLV